MKHTPRWQDCKPFVNALIDREYIVSVTVSGKPKQGFQLYMSEGIYLYMYELWQDGYKLGAKSAKSAKSTKRLVKR